MKCNICGKEQCFCFKSELNPKRCPVCKGSGEVPAGFYFIGTIVGYDKCRSCNGKGYVIC